MNSANQYLICFSALASEEEIKEIKEKSKGKSVFSGILYSRTMIPSLSNHYEETFCLNVFPVAWWPKYTKILFVKPKNLLTSSYSVHFFNLVGIRNFSIFRSLKSAIKRKIPFNTKKEGIDIFVIGANFAQIKAAVYLKKRNPKSRLILIVPDLPQYMSQNRTPLYSFLKKIDTSRIYFYSKKYVDKFVFFSKYMAPFFTSDPSRYIVSEGIPSEIPVKPSPKKEYISKTIVYTGIVKEEYSGLSEVLRCLKKINECSPTTLIVAGPNEDQQLVNELKMCPYAKYVGVVTPDEAKQIQENADVLINLRKNDPAFKYAFPSKLFSYLATGNPIISSHLDAIPDEYSDILFFADYANEKQLTEVILKILSFTKKERRLVFDKSVAFLKEKSVEKTVDRILKSLNSFD